MHDALTTTDQIDFLPLHYGKQQARRVNIAWRGTMVVLFLFILIVTAWNQSRNNSRLRAELEGIRQQHSEAVKQAQHLSTLQEELTKETIESELYLYLEHPWPRTHLLRSVLNILPKEIILTDFEISQGIARETARSRLRGSKNEKPQELGATADLRSIRTATQEAFDHISIQGWTEDMTRLHQFLGSVHHAPLIQRAELISVLGEPRAGRDGFSFHLQLTVKPGYGQANGPKEPRNLQATSTAGLGPFPEFGPQEPVRKISQPIREEL